MATKSGPANQHIILHNHYGHSDCCLCKVEREIEQLKQEATRLRNTIQSQDIKNGVLERQLKAKNQQAERLEGDLATFESNAVKQIGILNETIGVLRDQLAKLIEESKK